MKRKVGYYCTLSSIHVQKFQMQLRELAKELDGATEAHMKSLYRTIKYEIDTKNSLLCLYPTILNANNG
jgi:hypothetical protein